MSSLSNFRKDVFNTTQHRKDSDRHTLYVFPSPTVILSSGISKSVGLLNRNSKKWRKSTSLDLSHWPWPLITHNSALPPFGCSRNSKFPRHTSHMLWSSEWDQRKLTNAFEHGARTNICMHPHTHTSTQSKNQSILYLLKRPNNQDQIHLIDSWAKQINLEARQAQWATSPWRQWIIYLVEQDDSPV